MTNKKHRRVYCPSPPFPQSVLLLFLVISCSFARSFAAGQTPATPAIKSQSDTESVIRDSKDDVAIQADAIRAEQLNVALKLVADFPHDFDAQRILGIVYRVQGNKEAMYDCWQRCREISPDRADVYDQLAQYWSEKEDYAQAITYWRESLRLNPKQTNVQWRIGSALLSLGESEHAIPELRRAIAIDPRNASAHHSLGEALFQTQQFEDAKAHYLAAHQLDPNLKDAVYGLIKVSTRLDEADEAERYANIFQSLEERIAAADLAIRKSYDDLQNLRYYSAQTLVDAGTRYNRVSAVDRAEQLWSRAKELDAKSVASRELLARLAVQRGKLPTAVQCYEELISISPNNTEWHEKLGFVHARLGNLAAAEAALQQAIGLAPRRADGYRSLAKFYLNTNRELKRASDLALTALKLEPIADSYFVVGWAHAKNGKIIESQAALREAIRLDPGNRTYRQLLDGLLRQSTERK